MTASIIFCFPIVAGVSVDGVVFSSIVSVDISNTVQVSSWMSDVVSIPLNISEETSCTPVVDHNPLPNTVHSPVKTYPSVGIASCPRKL